MRSRKAHVSQHVCLGFVQRSGPGPDPSGKSLNRKAMINQRTGWGWISSQIACGIEAKAEALNLRSGQKGQQAAIISAIFGECINLLPKEGEERPGGEFNFLSGSTF